MPALAFAIFSYKLSLHKAQICGWHLFRRLALLGFSSLRRLNVSLVFRWHNETYITLF